MVQNLHYKVPLDLKLKSNYASNADTDTEILELHILSNQTLFAMLVL